MANSTLSNHPDAPTLAAYAFGKLIGVHRAALQVHLSRCSSCRQALAALVNRADAPSDPGTLPPVPSPTTAPAAAPLPASRPESLGPADLVNHPRYEILKLLGQGGMGAVYKARHRVMDRLVALKVVNPQFVGSATAVERFQREVQAAAQLHHANIVPAYDADHAGNTFFLVMEYVEGTDLEKYLEKKGPVPLAQACHFIQQAALGLQHAHEHGMVHRDIKPHNLMLTAGGVVKVMDFGLARLGRESGADSGLTGENVLMGTADYIAPEQAQDAHSADIRADIYSLGCTLFHLLVGRPPFPAGGIVQKIMAHATELPPLQVLPAATPAGLRIVLATMLEKDPGKRYQTPGEVAQALAPFLKKGTGSKATPAAAVPPPAEEATVDQALFAFAPAGEATTEMDADEALPTGKPGRKPRPRQAMPVALLIGGALFVAVGVVIALMYLTRGERPLATASERGLETSHSTQTKPTELLPAKFTNDLGMEFVLIPKGRFWMGGGGGQVGDKEVKIPQDFYLGIHEVTQEQWKKVIGLNPSWCSREGNGKNLVVAIPDSALRRFPAENVSWNDAQLFLDALNAREKSASWVYRLPREVEWEYACRGGPLVDRFDYGFDYYFEKRTNQLLPDQANYPHARSLRRPCPVASYRPNRLGIYDMHGNVWEWCADGEKAADGSMRYAIRGGSWAAVPATYCRANGRLIFPPSFRNSDLGVRLARVPK